MEALHTCNEWPLLADTCMLRLQITEFSIGEIATSLRAAPKLPLLSLSFMLPIATSTLSHRRHVSGQQNSPMLNKAATTTSRQGTCSFRGSVG